MKVDRTFGMPGPGHILQRHQNVLDVPELESGGFVCAEEGSVDRSSVTRNKEESGVGVIEG